MNTRAAMMNGVGATSRPVAGMERSVIRGGPSSFRVPDFASLHPGYECACVLLPAEAEVEAERKRRGDVEKRAGVVISPVGIIWLAIGANRVARAGRRADVARNDVGRARHGDHL